MTELPLTRATQGNRLQFAEMQEFLYSKMNVVSPK